MKPWLRIGWLTVCIVCLCGAQTTPQAPPALQPADSESPVADTTKPEAPVLVPSTPQAAPTAPAPVNQAPAEQAPPAATSGKPNPALEPPPQRKPSASAPAPKSAVKEGADGKPYVIGSLDVLYVRVWNNTNLTGMVDVRSDGMISLALIGELKADGMTVQQLTEELKLKLGDYLNNPEVDVQVTKVNSKKFVIVGKVGKAGEYPLVARTTIFEALANAGLRDDANLKKIYLLRGSVKHFFNYKDAEEGKRPEQDIAIENGDRIFVP